MFFYFDISKCQTYTTILFRYDRYSPKERYYLLFRMMSKLLFPRMTSVFIFCIEACTCTKFQCRRLVQHFHHYSILYITDALQFGNYFTVSEREIYHIEYCFHTFRNGNRNKDIMIRIFRLKKPQNIRNLTWYQIRKIENSYNVLRFGLFI